MKNFDQFELAVQAISGGKNCVKYDDMEFPSVMYAIPKMTYGDVLTGGSSEVLPCFIVDNEEKDVAYISRFINIIVNSRAYSLPMKDPANTINFDNALAACRAKGNGWCLTPDALWTAVALLSLKNGTLPHGNNNYGADHAYPQEKGIPTYKSGAQIGRTATGSGPATWNHDHSDCGIADMNGNVWEWTAGLRLNGGEINIIPEGQMFKNSCNLGADSTEWKAILQNGTLVAPGTASTLKYDSSSAGSADETVTNKGAPRINTVLANVAYTGANTQGDFGYYTTSLQSVAAASGVTVPNILKAYGLYPAAAELGGEYLHVRNYGERLPLRGGRWINAEIAGVFALYLLNGRAIVDTNVGFRSAFVEL